VLSTLFSSAVAGYVGSPAAAAVHGYTTAFAWSAGIFAVGAVATGLLLRPGAPVIHPVAEPVLVH
jgi:hypothetical protein